MPVIVMEVKTVQPHPNAEALVLYGMDAPGHVHVQIIANSEQIYELHDRVAVALPDSILKDGTKIKPTKLRGLISQGLALESVSEAVGADLSMTYCQPVLTQGIGIQKWPSIELLSSVRRSLEILGSYPRVTYRAKVKLDGTNAGIQIFPDGRVVAQSRTQIITPADDNYGFAQWVTQSLTEFSEMTQQYPITLFGEWCGRGIQNRTAISQINQRIFAIFAVQLGGLNTEVSNWVIDPQQISALLSPHPDILILPFFGEPIELDFGNRQQLESQMALLNQWVSEVEGCDPWVKEQFGIEGLGEGIVLYPDLQYGSGAESSESVGALGFSDLMFKAKGEKHQVVKTQKPVQIDPEIAQGVEAFVDLFVTPARLQQAVEAACEGQFERRRIGAFLKWLSLDIQKESVAELAASQLVWKDVSKKITTRGKTWYQEQVNRSQ